MKAMTEKMVVPTLRFGEFDEVWNTNKLREIFSISAGGDISAQNVSNVQTDSFKYPIYANAKKDKGFYGYSDVFKIEPNVVTVAGRGVHLGIAHSRKERFYPIVRLLILKPKIECDVDFFENRINLINLFIESTGVPQLTAPQISNYNVSFPTLPEQEKIASFLSSVDERIQKLERKKSLLEDYKKGVMQKIFSQELRFKDENGNHFPDWEEKKLGDVGETFNGLSGKTKEDFGNGKPFIEYMQIFGSAKIDTSKFGLVNINEGEKQKRVLKGDILFTTSSETPNEIGFSSVLTEDVGELYLNSFCFGYRPFSLNDLYPEFASYLFRSESVRRDVIVLAQGSTRYNMSKVQLMKVSISIPSLIEQKKIASFLSSIDKKIELVETQIQQSKTFKKGLLQQMFV